MGASCHKFVSRRRERDEEETRRPERRHDLVPRRGRRVTTLGQERKETKMMTKFPLGGKNGDADIV